MSLVVTAFTFTSFLKCKYIHTATCHFDQLLAVALPYTSLQEEREYLSLFAQIKTKEDYVELIERLSKTSVDNGVETLPKFLVF